MNITGPKIFFTIPIFGGINVTQTMLTSCIVTIILCTAGILLGRNLKKKPGRVQVMVEKAVSVLYNLVEEAMGKHNSSWAPYIGALFLSSILGSLLGMTGVLRSSTADLSTTATWAVMTTLIIWFQNIKNVGVKAWLKGFTEPIMVMTPMNIVSEFAQPVSLAFRHFGNIAGGSVITTMIYWALSGASAALFRLAAGSGISVTLILIAAGIILLFAVKPKGDKVRIAVKAVGAMCGILGILSFAQVLSGMISLQYPALSPALCTVLYFAGLFIILFGTGLIMFGKFKGHKAVGIITLTAGLALIIVILGGPSEVPVLAFGIPAVLSLYFDVFSGIMQAFVFSLLSMIYISNACPPPEERIVRGKKKKELAEQKKKEEVLQ